MANWNIDKAHSEVSFKVKHMVISTVSGSFDSFDSKMETENDNLENAKIAMDIDVQSLNTKNDYRDNHLKSNDFFAAEEHPQIKIAVDKVTKKSDEDYILHSLITIRGTQKPIDLKAEFGGVVKDMDGNTRMGFTIDGKINRKDFGLNWSATLEAGGMVVADDVRLLGDVEFVKQA